MRKALINKIIPFSSVDGPGNRTAIFLQGCNINCGYCHNPETIKRCNSCGVCVDSCPVGALMKDSNGKVQWDEKKCTECDECIRCCPIGASPKTKEMTAQQLASEIEKYSPFIQGITVSGGEATLQWEFLAELFEKTKAMGLTNFVDTNGTVSLWDKEKLLENTDKFMIDMKAVNKEEYKSLTGGDNSFVMENIQKMGEIDKIFEIRTVVVPGILNNEETVLRTAEIINQIDSSIRYKLIKFRNHGVRENYKNIESPREEYMEELKKIAVSAGCKDVVIL